MGVATGYRKKQLEPFVSSLARTSYRGAVLLFVDDLDSQTVDYLRDNGIQSVICSNGYPYLPDVAKRGVLPSALTHELSVYCSRYVLYYLYLLNHGDTAGSYDSILLTDVRDVLFQRDPFGSVSDAPLAFFLESPRLTLGGDPYNRDWISRAFGSAVLEQISGRVVSCSGTTVGTPSGLLDYLERMISIFAKAGPWSYPGIDQGVHNYVVYCCPPPRLRLYDNGEGAVLTMAGCVPGDFVFDREGLFIAKDGSPIPILHQYDRHRLTMKWFAGRSPAFRAVVRIPFLVEDAFERLRTALRSLKSGPRP